MIDPKTNEQANGVPVAFAPVADDVAAPNQVEAAEKGELVPEILETLFIEELSIDGMCGVY